jgi:hypothetical protein
MPESRHFEARVRRAEVSFARGPGKIETWDVVPAAGAATMTFRGAIAASCSPATVSGRAKRVYPWCCGPLNRERRPPLRPVLRVPPSGAYTAM